ncbi:MAG TPA: protein translocase subunit SecD [Gemmatimonadaceae bacterium]|nr:protein translocase subunit SecD [Gemmatimonadaceae bacterium]
MSLRARLILIGALMLAAVFLLFPRNVTIRTRNADGTYTNTVQRRVPLKYGLDLRGGMHLTLDIDESRQAVADPTEAIDRALKVVRNRIDEFGVAEPVVQKVGNDRIIVELPGVTDMRQAADIVQKSAFLQFQITDETKALERVLPRLDALARERGFGAQAAADTKQASAAAGLQQLLTPGADTAKRPGDSTAAAVPGLGAAQGGPVSRIVQAGQLPGEYVVASRDAPALEAFLERPDIEAALPPGKVIRWRGDTTAIGGQGYRAFYMLDARPIITGEYLIDAKPNQDPVEGVKVDFQLNNEGGRRFRLETGRHIRDHMAIVLDDRVMGQPPVIQSAIGTRGQITLSRDLQAAQDLALTLRAGALPVPLKVAEARNIGASLGEDAVRAGIRAGVVAIGLVILIMVVYYRFSGVLAVVGLAFYTLVTLAVLAGFDAVLTLPGIAGFVLSIGMAVDANFLIFERIREELVRGKTVRTAIDEGFRHAWSAIVDTHVTTALTAAILYQFGTGPVRGFAVALLAGLAASMVSAIFVVRTLFLVWLHRARGAQTLSI